MARGIAIVQIDHEIDDILEVTFHLSGEGDLVKTDPFHLIRSYLRGGYIHNGHIAVIRDFKKLFGYVDTHHRLAQPFLGFI